MSRDRTSELKLYELQRSIYTSLKQKALELEGEVSTELKAYRSSQLSHSLKPFNKSNLTELLKTIEKSNIVYLGDFHSFDQSSRNLKRLIDTLSKRGRKLALGVEFVHIEHQEIIDSYLNRYITELEFLESINYHESWRFPWSHYKIFFDLARNEKLDILALNSSGGLETRDDTAARILSSYYEANPNSTLLVLFGELHIIPEKLPQRVETYVQEELKQVIIHQNLDEIFWKINHHDIESDNQVLKFDDKEFVLMTSPPWIKYESMIYWYENLMDDPEFDIHDYMIETGVMGFNASIPENFLFIAQEINKTLDLQIPYSELEDFNLYDHQKLSLIQQKVESVSSDEISSFCKKLVTDGRVYRLPFGNDLYCSSYSSNRVSYLAGIHIHHLLLRVQDPDYDSNLLHENKSNRFIYLISQTIMAYFSSKIINPYRKCDRYQDILKKAQKGIRDNPFALAINIIDGTLNNDDFEKSLKDQELSNLYEAARIVGFYFGDLLYSDFFKSGSINFEILIEGLFHPIFDFNSFKDWMKILLPNKSYKNHKKRLL